MPGRLTLVGQDDTGGRIDGGGAPGTLTRRLVGAGAAAAMLGRFPALAQQDRQLDHAQVEPGLYAVTIGFVIAFVAIVTERRLAGRRTRRRTEQASRTRR